MQLHLKNVGVIKDGTIDVSGLTVMWHGKNDDLQIALRHSTCFAALKHEGGEC